MDSVHMKVVREMLRLYPEMTVKDLDEFSAWQAKRKARGQRAAVQKCGRCRKSRIKSRPSR